MLWDDQFEQLLRSVLRSLPPDRTLEPDEALATLGLGSLETVTLMMSLEAAYGFEFPDEDLTVKTFSTAGTLWSAVDRLAGSADGSG